MTKIPVWDPAIRAVHWVQATLVATALATGFFAAKPWLGVHVTVGYALAGLLLFRLVWGVFGPGHARFSSFIGHPRQVLDHLRAVAARRHSFHLGHNPAGGIMVVVLLGGLILLTITGLISLGGTRKDGPLAALVSFTAGARAGQIHQVLAWLLPALIALHLAGVFVESRLSGVNLVRAMIDGKKRLPADHPQPEHSPANLKAALTALAALGLTVALAVAWAGRQPIAGVPALALDPVFRAECGACHWAYHPSLLPAAAWRQMMSSLDDHFGEDASLAPERAALIERWLTDHAAETWDTLPAHRLRLVDPSQPFRITATPFWQREHHDLTLDGSFKRVKGGAGNCTACHGDAEQGHFSFRNIHPPLETLQ